MQLSEHSVNNLSHEVRAPRIRALTVAALLTVVAGDIQATYEDEQTAVRRSQEPSDGRQPSVCRQEASCLHIGHPLPE